METQHTPGPWQIDSGFLITSPHSGQIANIRGAGIYYNEEMNANACLIAAAPELLEALDELVSNFDGETDCTGILDLIANKSGKIRTAIAKARGQ